MQPSLLSPIVILMSIMAYEIMKVNLQVMFKESVEEVMLFDNSWLLASIFGSIAMGYFSDRFYSVSWRKPICLIGLFFSFITGLTFLHPALHHFANTSLILFVVIVNGLFASYVGAARAFYLDQFEKNMVLHFTITVICQCIPWIILGWLLMNHWMSHTALHYFSIAFTALALGITYCYAEDKRKKDREAKEGKYELYELSLKYNHLRYWAIVLSFFMLETSYHLMPYLGAYTFRDGAFYHEIFILGLGVGIGAPLALLFTKMDTLRMLQIGYGISFLYFTALLGFYLLGVTDYQNSIKYQFFIFAALSGVLWVLSLKEFLVNSKYSENGFVFGVIEGVQSLGEFGASYLSSLLTLGTMVKQRINLPIFIVFLGVALLLVSLEGIRNCFNRKNQNL